MGGKLEAAFPGIQVELKAGGRGDLTVTADGRELWNKNRMGNRFPKEDEIVEMLRQR